MTEHEAMNNIMHNWMRVKKNLAVAKATMPPNSLTETSLAFDVNQTEQILKSHGFVYRITYTHAKYTFEEQSQETFIFRRYRAKNLPAILNNYKNRQGLRHCEDMSIDMVIG